MVKMWLIDIMCGLLQQMEMQTVRYSSWLKVTFSRLSSSGPVIIHCY